MSEPLVTIYITNYNYDRFLKQSIESVLSQTYDNIELIIIDDGSTDSSKSIIKNYENHKNLTIVYQKQLGLNASNNTALKIAKGDYIIRLDADDYFDTSAVKKLINVIHKDKDTALVFPDYHIVDENNTIIRTVRRHNFNNEVTLFDQPAHGACTLIRKNILDQIGGYDSQFDRQDGYDLWLKIINNFKVKNINEPLFSYRQHNNNLTKDDSQLLRVRAKIKAKHVIKEKYKPLDVLCIIPIRGKEIDKLSNPLEVLGNKLLYEWTVQAALNSKKLNKIIISTSDTNVLQHVKDNYNDDQITLVDRNPRYARINYGVEKTILESLNIFVENNPKPDAIMILYIDYPFKCDWQIDELIDTMQIFNVDVVDGIRLDDRFYYKHDGRGLKPFVEGGGLHLERDQLYRRVGGMNLINTDFLLKYNKIIAGKIGHIHLDQITSFQIKSLVDHKIAKLLSEI